jgi:hypothetical protein
VRNENPDLSWSELMTIRRVFTILSVAAAVSGGVVFCAGSASADEQVWHGPNGPPPSVPMPAQVFYTDHGSAQPPALVYSNSSPGYAYKAATPSPSTAGRSARKASGRTAQ